MASIPGEFSLLLPEGGRSAIRRSEPFAAFAEAKRCNISRAVRELPPVRMLHRPSGKIVDVPPDADVMALFRAWEARG